MALAWKDIEKLSSATYNSGDIFRTPLGKLATSGAQDPFHLLTQSDVIWAFWREWYQGFLDGKPLDWELQKEIALIPDADWDKGPEHISGLIEEIQAKFLAKKLPQAETIHFNEETTRFYAKPQPVAKPDLLGAALAQVSDALDDVLADPSNGLNEKSRETRVLRRTINKYGNNPQRVEMDLTSIHASLTRQIASEELPASEANLALQRATQEGAQGIRATDAEIEENRRLLTKQALKELPEEKLAVLAKAARTEIRYLRGMMKKSGSLVGPPRL